MAEDQDNETETQDAPADAPADAPEEAAPQAAEAPAEAGAETAEAGEAGGEASEAASQPSASEPAAQGEQSEPTEQLSPKERRQKARSTHTGKARPQRSPEERQAERVAEREVKAGRRRARRAQEREKRSAAVARNAAKPEPTAPAHVPSEGVRKVRQGVVISDKADKTITVRIDVARRHRRYQKIVRSSSTLHAHDENNDAREGDTVRVIESRPLSRSKRWRLVDVLERAR
jgi:small subunit ribosomal protein S17